jgi:autophagy-related protein 11
VLEKLRIDLPLQPPVDDASSSTPVRPSQLATSYLSTAHLHLRDAKRLHHALGYQQLSLALSFRALDLRVLQLGDAFDEVSGNAHRELERQRGLLAGLDGDLELVGRVRIHPEFMSTAVQRAMRAGERGRTLGDYVSNVKMKQVAEACTRTHVELEERFEQAREAMQRLRDGTDEVRAAVTDSRYVLASLIFLINLLTHNSDYSLTLMSARDDVRIPMNG